MYAASRQQVKPLKPRLQRGGKHANRPGGRWKCTPFGTFGTTFSPGGVELLAVLCIEVLMSSEAGSRADFPLRGKSPQGNRGAFPTGRRPGFMVFAASGSAAAAGGIQNSSPEGRYHNPLNPLNPLNLLNPLNPHAAGVSRGDTTPFEPFEPFEPSEPSRRRCVHEPSAPRAASRPTLPLPFLPWYNE